MNRITIDRLTELDRNRTGPDKPGAFSFELVQARYPNRDDGDFRLFRQMKGEPFEITRVSGQCRCPSGRMTMDNPHLSACSIVFMLLMDAWMFFRSMGMFPSRRITHPYTGHLNWRRASTSIGVMPINSPSGVKTLGTSVSTVIFFALNCSISSLPFCWQPQRCI